MISGGFRADRGTTKYGPQCERRLRWLETAPDRYVSFLERQRQWAFSYRHPRLWAVYRLLARLRCRLAGHEFSALWEADKFVPAPKTRTSCLYCGAEKIAPSYGLISALAHHREHLTDLQEKLEQRGAVEQWDVFQSTISPDRWYVGRGKVAILATEIGASGELEARLAAAAVNALPMLLFALDTRDAEIARLRKDGR